MCVCLFAPSGEVFLGLSLVQRSRDQFQVSYWSPPSLPPPLSTPSGPALGRRQPAAVLTMEGKPFMLSCYRLFTYDVSQKWGVLDQPPSPLESRLVIQNQQLADPPSRSKYEINMKLSEIIFCRTLIYLIKCTIQEENMWYSEENSKYFDMVRKVRIFQPPSPSCQPKPKIGPTPPPKL